MLKFPVGIKWIVHDSDATDLEDCIVADHTRDNVRQEDGNAVTFLEAEIMQASGKAVNHVF